MYVLGRMSRSERARVVLPLLDGPDRASRRTGGAEEDEGVEDEERSKVPGPGASACVICAIWAAEGWTGGEGRAVGWLCETMGADCSAGCKGPVRVRGGRRGERDPPFSQLMKLSQK